jgi:hypothetical protein
MRLARGLEDERERFGEDQYLRDGKRIDLSRYSVHFDPGSPDGARQVNFKSPDSNNK